MRFPIKAGLFRRTVGHVNAVEGVSLTIREGHTTGVVGESGSGKTTLGLALLRLQASTGTIEFAGREIHALRAGALRPLRREMQIVFQDPYGSLSPRLSWADHRGRVYASTAWAGPRPSARSSKRARGSRARPRDPAPLSPRVLRRPAPGIAIARAMVLKPRFVVLDEPTSALDMSVQAQIVDLLRELQRRHRLTYLFISHDLRVVRALADEILVMRDGVVVEHGPAASIFDEPKDPYTRALMAAAFELQAI